MPQSLSNLYVHLIFSTKNREPLLVGDIANEIHPYLVGICENIGCPSIQTGGVADHVHCLFRLSRTMTIAEIVEKLKVNSSKWIKTKDTRYHSFHWQSGYGAFSVSHSNVDKVVKYIAEQETHHSKKTFQDEYREFLELHKVEYDERYVWD